MLYDFLNEQSKHDTTSYKDNVDVSTLIFLILLQSNTASRNGSSGNDSVDEIGTQSRLTVDIKICLYSRTFGH